MAMRPTWVAAVVVLVLVAGIAAYSVESTGSIVSNSEASTTYANSSSLDSSPRGSSTSSSDQATSRNSTSSTVSRVADIRSTFAATVSSPVMTPTGTNITMTNCGGVPDRPATMELQVVSDTTGMPVQQSALNVSSVFQAGCNGIEGQAHETLYFQRVGEGQSGWFELPNNSTDNFLAGAYNATVRYAGHSYSFHAGSYPASTTCALLDVPSGTVTVTTYFFSNHDCAGNFGAWAGRYSYYCFGEVYLRVLSDSDSAAVAGAVVTTTYDIPETCGAGDPSGLTSVNFTTSSTEWYAFGDSTYSFSLATGGALYNVTASQRPGSSTCVTLHVPSGTVDMTYGPRCLVGEPSNSTSISSTSTVSSSTTSGIDNSTTVGSSTSSSSISVLPSCLCWIPQGAPTYSVAGNGWVTAVATYYNGFNSTVTGTVYLVIWNSSGQEVGIDNTTTTVLSGHDATLHPTVVGLLPDGTRRLPPGTYSTSVYATLLDGTPISAVTNGSFKDEPLPVAFTGTDAAFGSGPVNFTLFFTNLYRSPLTGTLYGFANDTTTGSPLFNATATVSLLGDSDGNATLIFKTGTTTYCSLDFSFVLRASNGTALSPYDHEGGGLGCPGASIVSAPAINEVDGLRVLQLNMTDAAGITVTRLSRAVPQSSSSSVAAVTTS